jgi:hypothetical protein
MSQSFSSSSFVVVLRRRFLRDQQTDDEEGWNTTLKKSVSSSSPSPLYSQCLPDSKKNQLTQTVIPCPLREFYLADPTPA